jgi:Tol biopolymer transport system component
MNPGRPSDARRTFVLTTLMLMLVAIAAAPVALRAAEPGPLPLCRETVAAASTGAPGPADGVPDPAGRIAFAQLEPVDGGWVTSLHAIDPDGTDLAPLLDCESADPAWSPDGTRLAFTVAMEDGSTQVATIAPDGSDLRILTSGQGFRASPTWDPRGSWLIYDSSEPSQDPDDPTFRTGLWRVSADGAGTERIGDVDTIDGQARVSPDGNEVLFMRQMFTDDWVEKDWLETLLIRDLATGGQRLVLPDDRIAGHASWSPDGGSVIYNTDRGTDHSHLEITSAHDATAEPRILDPGPPVRYSWSPSFSPDGSRIVFGCVTRPDGDDGICLMDADGSRLTVLRDVEGVYENGYSWGPSGPR